MKISTTGRRTVALVGAALALAVSVPSVAWARHGSDDRASHIRHARGADDRAGHIRHARGADDGANHR
jgi:hypothetical protein